MKKMLCLMCAAVLAFSLIGCGGDKDTADGPKKITIAHGASESYHLHRALLEFKDEVEATGKFVVELYPSSQFGNDTEMIESVKTGDITMAVSPSSFFTDEAPAVAMIELPYVFPSRAAAIATLDSDWGQKQLDALQKAGLYGLGYFENGLRHLTNSKLAVRTPEDLDGLKLRTMQVPAHVTYWNSLGSSAEGAPFPELYTNLSTKVFDGQENPVAHIYSQKFFEVQKYLSLTGHVYTAYIPVVELDFWTSLSAEEQGVIETAMKNAYAYQLDLVDAEESKQLAEIGSNPTYPCEVIELTDAEKQAFIESAKPTLDQYRADLGAAVFDEFLAAVDAAAKTVSN